MIQKNCCTLTTDPRMHFFFTPIQGLKNQGAKDIKYVWKVYYYNLLRKNKGKVREIWKILKSVAGTDIRSPHWQCLDLWFSLSYEHFNSFLAQICDQLASEIPETGISPLKYMSTSVQHSIFISPVTQQELRTCIVNLKNRSRGHDNIKAGIIKCSLYYVILKPVLHAINLSCKVMICTYT